MGDDRTIRWGDRNPCASQMAMESHVRRQIAKLTNSKLETVESEVFVEGLRCEFPIDNKDAAAQVANAMFNATRNLARGFADPSQIPASFFLLGGGPENRVIWRIVTSAITQINDIAGALALRFSSPYVVLVHAAMLPRAKDGSLDLSASERATVDAILASGGDYRSMPYGYALRAVGRFFVVSESAIEEAPGYWLQGLEPNDERSIEPSSMLDGSYRLLDADETVRESKHPAPAGEA